MGTGLRESRSGPRLPLQGSRADSRPHALTDCLTAGVAELAGEQDVATLLDWMSPLYRFCVSETEVDEREAMLEGVVAMVGRGELDARGLLPIIRHEPHPALAARLVTHFLQASDRSGDDNFACVREITQLVIGGTAANPGAVFAGLVLFGDRRITGAARAVRCGLGISEIREFARARVNGLHAASIEFCLDWLLQIEETGCRASFAQVASMLTMMIVEDTDGYVVDTNNHVGPFVFRTVPDGVTKRFEDYREEVLPVLRHIERTTQNTEVIRNVMDVWERHAEAMTKARANHNVRKVVFGA
ncbi:MAG: hypothetical protein CMQ24_19225 [Gammaproteobacteria bacterium]|nr:hypothetical protein [Gammaproteobacteria bacterium]